MLLDLCLLLLNERRRPWQSGVSSLPKLGTRIETERFSAIRFLARCKCDLDSFFIYRLGLYIAVQNGFIGHEERFAGRKSRFRVRKMAFGVRGNRFGGKRNHLASRRKGFGSRRNRFGSKRNHLGSRRNRSGTRKNCFCTQSVPPASEL